MLRKINTYHLPVALFGSLFALIAIFFVSPLTSQTTAYILLILIITLATWARGLRAGLIITIVSLISVMYYLYSSRLLFSNSLVSLNELSTFILTAIAINYAIERYKKTNIEHQFKITESQYKKLIVKLEEEKKHMQEEVKLRDEFLSIASHELKTPLTTMLMKIQILLHNIRNVSLANFSVENLLTMLETAEEQTKRLSQMINDLLNVSLITTGRYTLEKKKEDISQLVKDVVKEFSEKLKSANYSLSIEANGPIEVFVDKLRISQVITNLLSNAIKYGDSKPIEVAVRRKNGVVAVSVKDHGMGVDEDQKERIFNLFERGRVNSSIKGLGVGLYISNQIIKAHSGKIKVESTPKRGSTFTIEIPVSGN